MRPEKPFHELKLVLDLETVAIADAAEYLEPATPPANYKDVTKIAAYVQEKTVEQLARAALDCDLNRIVALGVMLEERDVEPFVHLCRDDHEERQALKAFWDLVLCGPNQIRPLITFNGFAFDLPTLIRRSLYLEIERVRHLSIDKYRSPHVDLYQRLSFNGAIKAHSLAFYAKRFGFASAAPEITGADIAALVQADDWNAVRAHCADDVNLTHDLACRLGYLGSDEDELDDQDEAS